MDRLEKWLFFGFLFCHRVIDVTKKDSGEYRIWSLLLQGMWVLPIIRDEVIWIHDELAHFFKDLKNCKSEPGGLGKKSQEVKTFYITALKSSPKYRHQRRLYLTGLLNHYSGLLKDQPGLIGPRYLHISKLLSICRSEFYWLIRHKSNLPAKKQEKNLLEQFFKVGLNECVLLAESMHVRI